MIDLAALEALESFQRTDARGAGGEWLRNTLDTALETVSPPDYMAVPAMEDAVRRMVDVYQGYGQDRVIVRMVDWINIAPPVRRSFDEWW